MSTRRRRAILTTVAAIGGLFLFVYAIQRAGVGEIIDGIRDVGWGLVPILALGGVRFIIRAEAWRLCTPPASGVRWADAFKAFLAGDAVGNVTPLGLIASEPTKLLLLRHHLATRESVASLAIDNILYAGSVLAMLAAGIVVVLATVSLPFEWQEIGASALLALVAAAVFGLLALRGFWRSHRGERPPWRERLAVLRLAALAFLTEHSLRFWGAVSLDLLFHAIGVAEAFLVLHWIAADRSPTIAQAIVFESLNRAITVAFKFVPFRVGVDEASSGALAPLLGIDFQGGVALAVVRKVRNLFWAGVGLAIIAVHHAREERAMDRPGSEPAHPT